MRQLFEIDVPAEDLTGGIPPTCPALWRYRTQVTLDHFAHTFQQEVLSTDPGRNKVLAEFLRQVNHINPFTPTISFVIRLTVCQTILVMLVWRIWFLINR